MYIRTTKTSSGSVAVQVVCYIKRKMKVLSHIGSAKNEADLDILKKVASEWIHGKNNEQSSFLPDLDKSVSSDFLQISKSQYLGFRYQLLYDLLFKVVVKLKFHLIGNKVTSKIPKILTDLMITRVVHPCSKVESFEFISDFFGINHSRRDFYRTLSSLPSLKDEVERKAVTLAKKEFGFNFSLVFYDLTTLYFESFETDEIRKIGFSKDNKSSNPQIMIGLMVNNQGFPISYQLFPGNKFEGHTMAPSILSLKKKYKIKIMTIVADAAMLNEDNIDFLKKKGLNYIVGARMANLPIELIQEISQKLKQQEDSTIRIKTKKRGELVCHFSGARYRKDKREMEKQLQRAEEILKTPSKAEIIKRAKFLTNIAKDKKDKKFELNQTLVIKAKLLLGIKGYYTNHKTENDLEIVEQYKQLWNVEKSFKISKSDLKTRPIFHNKEEAIKTHILICFMALVVAKYIEIKTKKSIRSVVKELKKVTDARIYDKNRKKEIVMRSEINKNTEKILRSFGVSY